MLNPSNSGKNPGVAHGTNVGNAIIDHYRIFHYRRIVTRPKQAYSRYGQLTPVWVPASLKGSNYKTSGFSTVQLSIC